MDCGLNIAAVAKLFAEVDPDGNDNDSDSDNDKPRFTGIGGPGDIGIGTKSKSNSSAKSVDTSKKSKEIWDVKKEGEKCEDAFDKDNIALTNDPRQTPNYEMHYRQAVSTEDMFLQMGNKTSATASCENLVVEIHLPGDNFQDMQLNLKKQAIDLRSKIHFLYLNLPHPIDPRAGNAKWDKETQKLVITLHLSREFDDFNF